MPEDAFYPLYEKNVIISAPIVRSGEEVLSFVMLARKNAYSYRADIEFGTGIANYFATQLKLVDMEKQKEINFPDISAQRMSRYVRREQSFCIRWIIRRFRRFM